MSIHLSERSQGHHRNRAAYRFLPIHYLDRVLSVQTSFGIKQITILKQLIALYIDFDPLATKPALELTNHYIAQGLKQLNDRITQISLGWTIRSAFSSMAFDRWLLKLCEWITFTFLKGVKAFASWKPQSTLDVQFWECKSSFLDFIGGIFTALYRSGGVQMVGWVAALSRTRFLISEGE